MERVVLEAPAYDRVDGKNAYQSMLKRLTVGYPTREENQSMQIAAQIWQEQPDGTQQLSCELPIHQVLDLAIVLTRGMLHFRNAYRLPLLYDPACPTIERIGMQGDALTVNVCTENPQIAEDIVAFDQALRDLGELTGERLRILARILEEMECS